MFLLSFDFREMLSSLLASPILPTHRVVSRGFFSWKGTGQETEVRQDLKRNEGDGRTKGWGERERPLADRNNLHSGAIKGGQWRRKEGCRRRESERERSERKRP